jgi:hypothetical protein
LTVEEIQQLFELFALGRNGIDHAGQKMAYAFDKQDIMVHVSFSAYFLAAYSEER